MKIDLTDAQQRRMCNLLNRIDEASQGQIRTQNLVRMVRLELTRAQRRARRNEKKI